MCVHACRWCTPRRARMHAGGEVCVLVEHVGLRA